ncbi:MAG: hypothetical protein NTW86_21025 [Candidatus Sumerlaeota bacterium]|nr:hypothetical protein [Candidatus Sumerlaeota bacterium]
MAKRKATDLSRTQPLSLESLRDLGALETFQPPTEAFDPKGAWRNVYRIWLVGPKGRNDQGVLELKQTTRPDGALLLEVENTVVQSTGATHRTKASIVCANDALLTPKSWKLTSDIVNPNDTPVELAAWSETAEAKDDGVHVTDKTGASVRKVSKAFTCNWALYDVVQRMGGAASKPLEFDLLEDLQLLKPGQRLSYRGEASLDLNGQTLKLRQYQQIGHGILPILYWTDEKDRTLFAVMGERAYIFDPDARSHIAKTQTKAKGKKS